MPCACVIRKGLMGSVCPFRVLQYLLALRMHPRTKPLPACLPACRPSHAPLLLLPLHWLPSCQPCSFSLTSGPLHRQFPDQESSFPSFLPAWFFVPQVPSNTTLLGPGLSSLPSTVFSVVQIAICGLEQRFSEFLGCRMDFSKFPVHYRSILLQNILKLDY